MTKDPLEALPPRAQVGRIIKESTVKQGSLDPALVVGILAHKGIEIDDPELFRDVAESVLDHHGLLEEGDDDA